MPKAVNKNVRLWLDALRSGEFKQGREHLRVEKGSKFGYCCLGVACVIYQRETDDPVPELLADTLLPQRVADWLGLASTMGKFDSPIYHGNDQANDLTELNDDAKYSFKKIADFIESKPEGLFKVTGTSLPTWQISTDHNVFHS